MDLNRVRDSNISLLKNIDEDDYNLYCDQITLNFIELVKEKKFKNILFIHNSTFEPKIKDMVHYCLNHDMNCFINHYSKSGVINYLQVFTSEYPVEFYSYTIQPYVKSKKQFTNKIKFDLVVHPVMVFDHNRNCIDYNHQLNYVSLIKLDNNTKKCAYAFSIQEYSSISNENKSFKVDYIITNDETIKED